MHPLDLHTENDPAPRPGSPDKQLLGATRVVIPVKSFRLAKARLASELTATQRAVFARMAAENVIAAANGFDVAIACDDDEVADWALQQGTTVIRTDGLDLNGAVAEALRVSSSAGWERVAVVHADLPLADSLHDVIGGTCQEIVMAPDRHGRGTNVLVVPTNRSFDFRFGPDSLRYHRGSAAASGLSVRVVRSGKFSWDVDEPRDLAIPADLARGMRNQEEFLSLGLLRFPDSEAVSRSTKSTASGVRCK